MVIELKKGKITMSIMKQILNGHYSLYYKHEDYDILGWCVVKNLRYYVLQNKETKQLLKLPYVLNIEKDLTFKKEVKQISNNNREYRWPELYTIKLYAYDFRNTMPIYCQDETETDEQAEMIFNLVKKFLTHAEQIGQFYL